MLSEAHIRFQKCNDGTLQNGYRGYAAKSFVCIDLHDYKNKRRVITIMMIFTSHAIWYPRILWAQARGTIYDSNKISNLCKCCATFSLQNAWLCNLHTIHYCYYYIYVYNYVIYARFMPNTIVILMQWSCQSLITITLMWWNLFLVVTSNHIGIDDAHMSAIARFLKFGTFRVILRSEIAFTWARRRTYYDTCIWMLTVFDGLTTSLFLDRTRLQNSGLDVVRHLWYDVLVG